MTQNKQDLLLSLFKEFDSLPDSAHVRLPILQNLYGVSASTIWRGVRKGIIPSPVKLTENTTAWNVGLIRASLVHRGAQSCQ